MSSMQDVSSPGGSASQPDLFLGSQASSGQPMATSGLAWTSTAAGLPANPYVRSNLIAGSAGPSLDYNAAAAQQGALLRGVQQSQQQGQFHLPGMSADLRLASVPGLAHSLALATAAAPPPVQAVLPSMSMPGSQTAGAAAAQEPDAGQTKKRKANMPSELSREIADVRSAR